MLNTRPLIAGNWKMHGLKGQAGEIRAIAERLKASPKGADILICPPATLIERAVAAAGGAILIGGQDCHSEVTGPFTGDVSAQMLRDDGASMVIVGHSERRKHYGESDAIVAAKAAAARRAGLVPVICVGESAAVRESGEALAFCGRQVTASVPKILADGNCVVAYEPLWAIGGAQAAQPEDILGMHGHIRQVLTDHLGPAGAKVRILYGGSVTAANAAGILALDDVDGVLVGRESLEFNKFEAIIAAADNSR